MARLGSMGCRPRSWDLLGFLSSPHCGELRKPIRSHERCPQPIDPQVPPLRLCGDVSAGSSAKPARERGLSLDPYRSRTPVRCFVAPCLMPFDAKIPTPHPISEFSSATDKSASSPGCSISAAPIDLAAARTCSPRMAPRYREAFVTVSSRRSFSVSELHLKDFDRCDALT